MNGLHINYSGTLSDIADTVGHHRTDTGEKPVRDSEGSLPVTRLSVCCQIVPVNWLVRIPDTAGTLAKQWTHKNPSCFRTRAEGGLDCSTDQTDSRNSASKYILYDGSFTFSILAINVRDDPSLMDSISNILYRLPVLFLRTVCPTWNGGRFETIIQPPPSQSNAVFAYCSATRFASSFCARVLFG